MKVIKFFSLFFLFIICMNGCGEREKVSLIKHEFKNTIFVETSTRWPSEERHVTVIFSKELPKNYEACVGLESILEEFYKDNNPRLSIGEYCDTLFVLINYPEIMISSKAREFAAAHESFHIGHQIYGTPYIMGLKLEDRSFDFISDFTKLMEESLKQDNKKLFCGRVEKYLSTLPKNKQNLILYKSTYEWPAEFYSKQYAFGNNEKEYYKLRDSISSYLDGDGRYWADFYKLSISVIKNIEQKVSRKSWQSRVNNGKSIFDIFMEVNGCRTYTKHYLRVDVNKWELKESY